MDFFRYTFSFHILFYKISGLSQFYLSEFATHVEFPSLNYPWVCHFAILWIPSGGRGLGEQHFYLFSVGEKSFTFPEGGLIPVHHSIFSTI